MLGLVQIKDIGVLDMKEIMLITQRVFDEQIPSMQMQIKHKTVPNHTERQKSRFQMQTSYISLISSQHP
jgi:hypothetical protein